MDVTCSCGATASVTDSGVQYRAPGRCREVEQLRQERPGERIPMAPGGCRTFKRIIDIAVADLRR